MRSRIKRASRTPPPPRRPADADSPVPKAPASARTAETTPPKSRTREQKASPRPVKERTPRESSVSLAPNTPHVNLAIRVRRPLDDRLVELIHALRRDDVRSSKVELIEMLLWELPDVPNEDLRRRLAEFRRAAPRGSGSSAEL